MPTAGLQQPNAASRRTMTRWRTAWRRYARRASKRDGQLPATKVPAPARRARARHSDRSCSYARTELRGHGAHRCRLQEDGPVGARERRRAGFGTPTSSSSPWIRGAPHSGFATMISRMSWRISAVSLADARSRFPAPPGSCRTCHVAFSSDSPVSGFTWDTYTQYQLHQPTIQGFVCSDSKLMPHALELLAEHGPAPPGRIGDLLGPGLEGIRRGLPTDCDTNAAPYLLYRVRRPRGRRAGVGADGVHEDPRAAAGGGGRAQACHWPPKYFRAPPDPGCLQVHLDCGPDNCKR
jgi:hypothetical protein